MRNAIQGNDLKKISVIQKMFSKFNEYLVHASRAKNLPESSLRAGSLSVLFVQVQNILAAEVGKQSGPARMVRGKMSLQKSH